MIKYDVIKGHADRHPHTPAITDGKLQLSWRDLADRVACVTTGLAKAVASRQVGNDHLRMVFLSENRWEVCVLQGACATMGLPLVGIDDSLSEEFIASCLDKVRPSLLAVSSSRYPLAARAVQAYMSRAGGAGRPDLVLFDPPSAYPGEACGVSWDALMSTAPDPRTWPSLPFEGLGFTSGTTSAPKLVLRSSSFEARRQRDVTEFFGITSADVYLNTVPLYHASGPGWVRIFATNGAHIVLASHDAPGAMLDALVSHRVTASLMVPPTLKTLLDHAEARASATTGDGGPRPAGRLPGTALRMLVTGGRHVSPALVRQTTRILGNVLHVYYGTTETGLNTLTGHGELGQAPDSAGRPFPGNRIVVLDELHRPVEAGRHGRVAVAGYMLADRYDNGDSPTVTLDGERFWLTPDIGRYDDSGALHIMSRDLLPEARNLDVIALEAHLKDAFTVPDLAVLADVEDGRPVLRVAYVPQRRQPVVEPAPTRVAAEAHEWALGATATAHPVAAIPYSPTGKIRTSVLCRLVNGSGSDRSGQ